MPVLRRTPDEAAFAAAGPQGWESPYRPADAENGPCSDLPEAQHQQAEQGTQGLSVSSQGLGHHPAQSGLVQRHKLYPDAKGYSVSGSGHGLAQPPGFGVEGVEHDGGRVLSRSLAGGPAAS